MIERWKSSRNAVAWAPPNKADLATVTGNYPACQQDINSGPLIKPFPKDTKYALSGKLTTIGPLPP